MQQSWLEIKKLIPPLILHLKGSRQSLMKFLADVNIAQLVIRFLRNLNLNVLDAKKYLLLESDIKIISIAQQENRIILTRRDIK